MKQCVKSRKWRRKFESMFFRVIYDICLNYQCVALIGKGKERNRSLIYIEQTPNVAKTLKYMKEGNFDSSGKNLNFIANMHH